MKRKISIIIVIVSLLVGGVYFYKKASAKQDYQVYTVEKGDVQKIVNVDAQVVPATYANISTEIPSRINSVDVVLNQHVKKGQKLFELDKEAIYAQINNARLAVERAELAERNSRRKKDELKPEERLSIKKATDQARQSLNEIYAQAEKTTIISPIDGVIVEQNARVGEISTGIVIKIISTNSLRVEALIPEVDIAKIQNNNSVNIVFDAYLSEIVKGSVVSMDVGKTMKVNNTYYKAIISIGEDSGLLIRDGMNASADIIIEEKDYVAVLPRDIVERDNNGYFVHMLNSGGKSVEQFKKVYFKEGVVGEDNIEILSDLQLGDKVVKFSQK